MTYRPRKVHKRPKRDWTPINVAELCSGGVFVHGEHLSPPALEAAWGSLRDILLAKYDRACPGNRPFAWWLYDAPEMRRCLQGEHECPARDQIIQEHKQGRWYFGTPGIRLAVVDCAQCWDEMRESQPRYLRRLGLLTAREAVIVPRDLTACDDWAQAQYPTVYPPVPWKLGEGQVWCKALLREGG